MATESTPVKSPHSGFTTSNSSQMMDFPKQHYHMVLDEDYKTDNANVLEAKFKNARGFVKYKMAQSTTLTDGNWKCNTSDVVTVDMSHKEVNSVCEVKPNQLSQHTDFGVKSFVDDKLLINPYVRLEGDRSLGNKKLFLGMVSRWGDFMLRDQLVVKSKDDMTCDARLNYVHDNLNLTVAKSTDVVNMKVLNYRLLGGYQDCTYSAYFELLKESGNHWANWARVHLGYKMCDKSDVAVSLHQNCEDTNVRKMDFGFRYNLDKNTQFKQKVNCNLDTSCFFKHKLCDSTWMLMSMSTNLKNLGSPTQASGYSGFMNYPFNYGLKLKFDN